MNCLVSNTEFFTISTQLYVRLRRVTGHVIDVIYMQDSQDYTQYVMNLALNTHDVELHRYANILQNWVKSEIVEEKPVIAVVQSQNIKTEMQYEEEIDAAEIYKAEVPHHYIGALR